MLRATCPVTSCPRATSAFLSTLEAEGWVRGADHRWYCPNHTMYAPVDPKPEMTADATGAAEMIEEDSDRIQIWLSRVKTTGGKVSYSIVTQGRGERSEFVSDKRSTFERQAKAMVTQLVSEIGNPPDDEEDEDF